jgi:16S rRNA processing protein RimM
VHLRGARRPHRGRGLSAAPLLLTPPPAQDAKPEDPEEYYAHQLIGLAVVDVDGTHLGEVKAVVHGSAQDLLTVRTPDGRDTLVPFVSALVPEVDLETGRVVVADRPGLVTPFPDDVADPTPAGPTAADAPEGDRS